jgi:hypothetical protein
VVSGWALWSRDAARFVDSGHVRAWTFTMVYCQLNKGGAEVDPSSLFFGLERTPVDIGFRAPVHRFVVRFVVVVVLLTPESW